MPELWKCADGSEMFCGRSTNNTLIAVLLAAEFCLSWILVWLVCQRSNTFSFKKKKVDVDVCTAVKIYIILGIDHCIDHCVEMCAKT